MIDLSSALSASGVDPAVFELQPDYVAVLLLAGGLSGGPSDDQSDGWLREAETSAAARLSGSAPEDRPQVARWRDAYRAFGAKPQRTRNSLEALLRRVSDGLPRINRLTDLYNAVSILHEVPIGGEDFATYIGPARLTRSSGVEPFATIVDGQAVVEQAEPGEVVWVDDAGVTCRRWNWRQCSRTQLSEATTTALFIIDALGPNAGELATAAADDLERRLREFEPDITATRRTLAYGRLTKEHRMFMVSFIFKPGEYDEEFNRLNDEIQAIADASAGFLGSEGWWSKDRTVRNATYYWADLEHLREFASAIPHRTAKGRYERWYDGYHVVVAEILEGYGDGRIPHLTSEISRIRRPPSERVS